MSSLVPQDILDALTDVEMPKLAPEPGFDHSLNLQGWKVPVYASSALLSAAGPQGYARRWS